MNLASQRVEVIADYWVKSQGEKGLPLAIPHLDLEKRKESFISSNISVISGGILKNVKSLG